MIPDSFDDLTIEMIEKLPAPILIIGAGGFIGFNAFRKLRKYRGDDVIGMFKSGSLTDTERYNIMTPDEQRDVLHGNIVNRDLIEIMFNQIKPETVFNFAGYGNYSWQKDAPTIYDVNFISLINLMEASKKHGVKAFINAGSQSEYGYNCAAPREDDPLRPDTHYAVSKGAASLLMSYYTAIENVLAAHLRLYSVYGEYEDSRRLIPTAIAAGRRGEFPPFVNPEISRDYIYIDDVLAAFIHAAHYVGSLDKRILNIGTGTTTSIKGFAGILADVFPALKDVNPVFTMESRAWDHYMMIADINAAKSQLNWTPRVTLADGLRMTEERTR